MDHSKKEQTDEELIRNLKEIEKDYLPLDRDRLILLVIDFLQSKNIESTFDKIVVTAFKLFPKKFSLIGFPEYPDALTVDHCARLHSTRTKGWLYGGVQSGFKITEKGKYFLDEAKKMLDGKIKTTRHYSTIPRRKEVTFIDVLKRTKAYKKYMHNEKEEITELDILDSLKIPQGSRHMTDDYFKKYMDYANRINDLSVIKFLEFIKTKLKGNKNA